MRKFSDYLNTTIIDNDFFYERDWEVEMEMYAYVLKDLLIYIVVLTHLLQK